MTTIHRLRVIRAKWRKIRFGDVISVLLVLSVAAGTYLEGARSANDVRECLASVGARLSQSDELGVFWVACNGKSLEQTDLFDSFQHLPDIETLSLSRSTFDSTQLSCLPQLRHLRSLGLGDTNADDNGLVYVGDCSGLEVLSLNGTQVTSRGLASLSRLTNLRYLSLARSQVDDEGLDALARIPNLAEVDLRSTNVTAGGIERLASLRKDCRIVANASEAQRCW